jgi:hypothetical protein
MFQRLQFDADLDQIHFSASRLYNPGTDQLWWESAEPFPKSKADYIKNGQILSGNNFYLDSSVSYRNLRAKVNTYGKSTLFQLSIMSLS